MAEFASNALIGKIVQGESAFGALFSPSMTANVVKNTFAVLDSTAALTTVVNANRSAQVALSSIINQSLQGDRTRDYAATLQVSSQLSSSIDKFRPMSADISATSILVTNNNVIKSTSATLVFAITHEFNVGEIEPATATLVNQFTFVSAGVVKRNASATITTSASVTSTPTEIPIGDMFFVATRDSEANALLNYASDITEDAFGNIYTASLQRNGVSPNFTYSTLVQKLSPRGRVLWSKKIASYETGWINIECIGYNLFFTARLNSTVQYIVKSDLDGNLITSKYIATNSNNRITNLMSDGTYLYALHQSDYGASNQNARTQILKLDTNLTQISGNSMTFTRGF